MTELGWEGQCDKCRQWWTLDEESWKPKQGMRTCAACIREDRAAYLRRLRNDNPEMRARHREASRANQEAKRSADPQAYLEYQRRWFAKNHVRLNAERAEYYAIQLELLGKKPQRSLREETPETLAYRAAFRRRWMADHPNAEPTISLEKRRAYNREWMRRRREKAA